MIEYIKPSLLGVSFCELKYSDELAQAISLFVVRCGNNIGWTWKDLDGKSYGDYINNDKDDTVDVVLEILLDQAHESINKIKDKLYGRD